MSDHYNTDEWRDEMRRDAFQPTYNDLDDFAESHPLAEYEGQAAAVLIDDDDKHCRLIESHGPSVMRLMLRHCGHGEGLPYSYDTDQRVLDEGAISIWLKGEIEQEALRLQEEAYQS